MAESPLQKLCLKDDQHRLIWANTHFLNCIGAKTIDKVMQLTDYDLPWQDYADIYFQHETDALSNCCYSAIQPIKDAHGQTFIGLITKSLKIASNGAKQIYTSFTEIQNTKVNQLIHMLLKYNPHDEPVTYAINKPILNLSLRESECLFYFLHGKSSKTIAKILNISHRTVEQHLQNVKIKLNCSTKGELMDFAVGIGLVNIVPFNIFQNPIQLDKIA